VHRGFEVLAHTGRSRQLHSQRNPQLSTRSGIGGYGSDQGPCDLWRVVQKSYLEATVRFGSLSHRCGST